MNAPLLPPEDLPPSELSLSDRLLARQIEISLSQHFFNRCLQEAYHSGDSLARRDSSLAQLLSDCHWSISLQAKQPTLIVETTDVETSWQILKQLKHFGKILEELAIARIRVCPPLEVSSCLEVRIDELSLY